MPKLAGGGRLVSTKSDRATKTTSRGKNKNSLKNVWRCDLPICIFADGYIGDNYLLSVVKMQSRQPLPTDLTFLPSTLGFVINNCYWNFGEETDMHPRFFLLVLL